MSLTLPFNNCHFVLQFQRMRVNAFFLMSLFPTFSCEVIRDWKTGESLCYAFIEFEKVRHNTDM